MQISTTKVSNGRIEVSVESLSEGQTVRVVVLETEPVRLSESEARWLRNVLDESDDEPSRDFDRFLLELEASE